MNIRYLRILLGLGLVVASPAVIAHEIWIERDGNGPARIYLGEPEEALPTGGDPEFDHLKAPKMIPATNAPLARKAGFLEVEAAPGDVRAQDDAVFAPWGPKDKKEGVAYFARAGRSETRSAMALEITPRTSGGSSFVLLRDGKPVTDTAVKVISPDKWSKFIRTDPQGSIIVPVREKGRYLLSTALKDEGTFTTSLGKVAVLHLIATTTFVVD